MTPIGNIVGMSGDSSRAFGRKPYSVTQWRPLTTISGANPNAKVA